MSALSRNSSSSAVAVVSAVEVQGDRRAADREPAQGEPGRPAGVDAGRRAPLDAQIRDRQPGSAEHDQAVALRRHDHALAHARPAQSDPGRRALVQHDRTIPAGRQADGLPGPRRADHRGDRRAGRDGGRARLALEQVSRRVGAGNPRRRRQPDDGDQHRQGAEKRGTSEHSFSVRDFCSLVNPHTCTSDHLTG
jgi:hypothetical protein